MVVQNWRTTQLWKLLLQEGRSTDNTRSYIASWLDDVEILLAKSNTAPMDFTLHDHDHSYRVAERMASLLSANTMELLSDFEIGMLLMSAYLHDVGMNPNRSAVRSIRDFLFTGASEGLENSEAELLQRWLDETYPGVEPPVGQELGGRERLHYAEYLTAYFCRHRHNDWSEKFINERAARSASPPYPAWTDDLILLCKSHHYGLNELLDDSFNLRVVGSGHKLVNLRYLAAALRLSDVLDFDPERTPSVIVSQRSVDPKSHIYWHKDHDIALTSDVRTGQTLITARTPSARIHRAVLETADAVDLELQTCAAIKDQNGYARGFALETSNHYEWVWSRSSARDIAPRSNSFVYMDGAFRPDPLRVISLVSGTRLYSTPLSSIRELLQNSFDAVREQISLECLSNPNALDSIPTVHHVSLFWEEIGEHTWLVCSDTGVGMTKRVLERNFLVAGSTPRAEVLELQRACATKNIKFSRSGEFGIGVLSYFMVADTIVVETRASDEAHRERDDSGWSFYIDGIAGFGELRKLQGNQRGTTVKLRIKPSMVEVLRRELGPYLQSLLARIPCVLSIKLPNFERQLCEGWAKNWDDFRTELLSRGTGHREEDAEVHARRAEWQTIVDEPARRIRLFGPSIGELPNALGVFRISLPYFSLDEGPSLKYLHKRGDAFQVCAWGHFVQPRPIVLVSWRGSTLPRSDRFGDPAGISNHLGDRETPLIIEIDLDQGAVISANRERLQIEMRDIILNQIETAADRILSNFVAAQRNSTTFSALSPKWIARIKSKTIAERASSNWFAQQGDVIHWRPVRFPALTHGSTDIIQNRFRAVKSILSNGIFYDERGYQVAAPLANLRPSSIVFFGNKQLPYIRIRYDGVSLNPYFRADRSWREQLVDAEFPREMCNVVAIRESITRFILNRRHPVAKLASPKALETYLSRFGEHADSDVNKSLDHITDAEMAACWLISKSSAIQR